MKLSQLLRTHLACLSLIVWIMAGFPSIPGAHAEAGAAKSANLWIQSGATRHAFHVKTAATPQQQAQGLMHRTSLPRDEGMLFLAPHDKLWVMWMKDTPLPLDMLFIDSGGTIVYVAPDTTPYSTQAVTNGTPVRAVLELLGGTAEMLGLQVGDRVIHSGFTP